MLDHVLIAGSGIAGLNMAAALAPLSRRVEIWERDTEPGAAARPGVPHGDQIHVLLEGGIRALDRLFPRLLSDLAAHGIRPTGMSREVAWLTAPGWAVPLDTAHRMVTCTRPFLESRLRGFVSELANVDIQYGRAVTGFDGERVHAAAEQRTPTLFVDATGRRSKAVSWLGAEVGVDTVDTSAGYATVRLPSGMPAPWRGLVLQSDSANTRRGEIVPVENGEWMLTLVGCLGDRPPPQWDEFVDFAAGLRSPELAQLLAAQDRAPVKAFRPAGNRRHRFDKLSNWPANLLVVGDAALVLNPVYAQGMTVAAQTALAVRDRLERGRRDRLQNVVTASGKWAWFMASSADRRILAGPNGSSGAVDRYLDRLVEVARVNATARSAALDVITLCAHPAALFAPRVLATLGTRVGDIACPVGTALAPRKA
ncbi:MAG: NAD(P)-binding protein [Mycobacteriaceae bacterium]|nr:NAD(P)-binding protein [Mycobacteriaceae bacterium]